MKQLYPPAPICPWPWKSPMNQAALPASTRGEPTARTWHRDAGGRNSAQGRRDSPSPGAALRPRSCISTSHCCPELHSAPLPSPRRRGAAGTKPFKEHAAVARQPIPQVTDVYTATDAGYDILTPDKAAAYNKCFLHGTLSTAHFNPLSRSKQSSGSKKANRV